MPSLLDIYNLALLRVKASPLTSPTETSRAAQACNASYAIQRPALLRRHRWPFARRRVALAPSPPAPAFGWKNRMVLPADCEYVISASPWVDGMRDTLTDAPGTYQIEGPDLLTDDDVMYLLYIRDVTDPTRFDSLFTSALTWAIASDLAFSVAGNRELGQTYNEAFERQVTLARRANSIEQPAEVLVTEQRLETPGRFDSRPHGYSSRGQG